MKLEITGAFSTVDTDFKKKSTTKTTSCNGQKKVRVHGKKPGKSSSKIRRKDPRNQSGRSHTNT